MTNEENVKEWVSILHYQKCPIGKGVASDDICVDCPNFAGYVSKTKSHGLLLKFTKDKSDADKIGDHYFYICKILKDENGNPYKQKKI